MATQLCHTRVLCSKPAQYIQRTCDVHLDQRSALGVAVFANGRSRCNLMRNYLALTRSKCGLQRQTSKGLQLLPCTIALTGRAFGLVGKMQVASTTVQFFSPLDAQDGLLRRLVRLATVSTPRNTTRHTFISKRRAQFPLSKCSSTEHSGCPRRFRSTLEMRKVILSITTASRQPPGVSHATTSLAPWGGPRSLRQPRSPFRSAAPLTAPRPTS
mmetsp:Transcript_7546/g.22268  ORF Transcript_7546/g.22268 Transcript_7546/m.22268 type:complete len:214 (+) Transcript_7546:749-1390(+)